MQDLQQIRSGIERNLGRRVYLKTHRGRSRSVESEGILENSFPSVFTVLVQQGKRERRISYAYSDLFTRHLELRWLDEPQ